MQRALLHARCIASAPIIRHEQTTARNTEVKLHKHLRLKVTPIDCISNQLYSLYRRACLQQRNQLDNLHSAINSIPSALRALHHCNLEKCRSATNLVHANCSYWNSIREPTRRYIKPHIINSSYNHSHTSMTGRVPPPCRSFQPIRRHCSVVFIVIN